MSYKKFLTINDCTCVIAINEISKIEKLLDNRWKITMGNGAGFYITNEEHEVLINFIDIV